MKMKDKTTTEIPTEDDKIIKSIETQELRSNFVPIDDLPSRYLFYPENTKLAAKPMSVADVKSLANMSDSNYDSIINGVLSRNVTGIKINQLLRADKYYLIFFLRANTFKSSGYEIAYHCNFCSKDTSYDFSVEVLEIEYAKQNAKMDVELPVSKNKLHLRYKTVEDETKFNEFKRINAKSIKDFDEDILDIACDIVSIDDETQSLTKKYEYIINLNPTDYAYLVSYLDNISFGVKENVNAVCNSCKEVTPLGVTFHSEFFIPKFVF